MRRREKHATTPSFLLIATLGLLALALCAAAQADSKRAIAIFSTPGTDVSNVVAVLRAAGAWVAPDELVAELLPVTQQGQHRRLREPAGKPPLQPPKQLIAHEQLINLTGQVPPGAAAWACHVGATTHALRALLKVLPRVHIIHVVQDARHALAAAAAAQPAVHAAAQEWAQLNLDVKNWATRRGLGLARQYSIARLEDLCSPAGAGEAAQVLLQNAGLAANTPATSTSTLVPAMASKGCPAGLLRAGGEAAASALDAELYRALSAFDYWPAAPPGLPDWLAAPAAMAELAGVAAAWPDRRDPVIVTFVSAGYELVLDNWLAWLRDSGAALSRVLVVAARDNVQSVRAKIRHRGVLVLGLDPLVPDKVAPGTSDELGRKSDPKRHYRARVWLERVRVMYELVRHRVPVVMSDLDAIWTRNAVADLLAKPEGRARGFDLMMSPGYFPFDVYDQLGVVGCMGFLYANTTQATQLLLGNMLLEKLHQLRLRNVKFYNDQRVLNEHLVRANIAVNASAARPHAPASSAAAGGAKAGNPVPIEGVKLTTAPQGLRVLFLSDRHYTRVCSNSSSYSEAVVVHCQSHNSGAAKMAFLRSIGLWKDRAAPPAAAAVQV